jgi:hypothetical protein
MIPPITQEALADMIGTTRSRVSKFMNRFRVLGYIQYNGRIHVHKSLLNVVLHDRLPDQRAKLPVILNPERTAARRRTARKLFEKPIRELGHAWTISTATRDFLTWSLTARQEAFVVSHRCLKRRVEGKRFHANPPCCIASKTGIVQRRYDKPDVL